VLDRGIPLIADEGARAAVATLGDMMRCREQRRSRGETSKMTASAESIECAVTVLRIEPSSVMAGQSRSKNGVASLAYVPGHPDQGGTVPS
jgi:hypothetical protein